MNPHYMVSTPGIAPRPGRDQDPTRGMRSEVLEQFRPPNGKASKRYELKVCLFPLLSPTPCMSSA